MTEMSPQSPKDAAVVEIVAAYLAAAGRVRTHSTRVAIPCLGVWLARSRGGRSRRAEELVEVRLDIPPDQRPRPLRS